MLVLYISLLNFKNFVLYNFLFFGWGGGGLGLYLYFIYEKYVLKYNKILILGFL